MKTQILFEDKDIIVCYKPSGIAVQTAGISQQDMVSELKNYLAAQGQKNPYVGVVHRLDQPVSGVLVFAKNQAAAADLSTQVQDNRMQKVYRAYVYGALDETGKERTLEDILYKDAKTNMSRVAAPGSKEAKLGKKAKLSYKVLQEIPVDEEVYSELEIKLHTGRHHQIRVQLSHAGHPILGDTKYGTLESAEISAKLEKGLKLCAYKLTFIHPKTKKEVEFSTPKCF